MSRFALICSELDLNWVDILRTTISLNVILRGLRIKISLRGDRLFTTYLIGLIVLLAALESRWIIRCGATNTKTNKLCVLRGGGG